MRILSGILLISFGASAQTFDVASIKPIVPNKPSMGLQIGHGSLTVIDRLLGLIMTAYSVKNRDLVEGGPEWIERDSYDVTAKGDPAAGPDQIRVMLQALLADRCHLKVHRETKPVSGYALVVDQKKAPLPKESKEGTVRDGRGSIQVDDTGFQTRGTSMGLLSKFLWTVMGHPVADQTGLAGIYDFRITYDDPKLNTAPGADSDRFGSIFAALETVGLKLTAAKVPVEILHIDSVERPSEN